MFKQYKTDSHQNKDNAEKDSRFKQLCKSLIVLIVTVMLCMIIAEIILRIHYALVYTGTIEDIYAPSGYDDKTDYYNGKPHLSLGQIMNPSKYFRIIYELKPNLDAYFLSTPLHTNAQGWRDSPFNNYKDNHTIRIIGIGDSFMFGWKVKEDERYMDLFEQRLNQEYPQYHWETYVMAAPGYNLVMETEVAKQYAMQYDPDAIIYGFGYNDVCLPNFIAEKKNIFSFDSFITYYIARVKSKTALILTAQYNNTPMWKLCDEAAVPQEYQSFVGENNFNDALQTLAAMGEKRDIPTIFFIIGTYLHPQVPKPMYDFNSGESFDCTNCPLDKNGNLNPLFISVDDPHPSILGHERMADALFTQMRDQGIILILMDKKVNATTANK